MKEKLHFVLQKEKREIGEKYSLPVLHWEE